MKRLFDDLRAAFGLLTRLPCRAGSPAGSYWAWPLAGATIGLLAGTVALLLLTLDLPVGFAVAVALAVQVALTGGLHEDGLADTADGFWGGRTVERRLEIMKDSRIGSYGTLALILTLMARWSVLTALFEAGAVMVPLIAAGAASRAAMTGVMAGLPNARSDGLSASVGRPGRDEAAMALVTALVVAVVVCGPPGLVAVMIALAASAVVALVARIKIRGQTGDVLGASQQLAEIAALAGLVVFL